MSVLIKGMDMPRNCGECRFAGVCGVHKAEEWPDLESIMFNDVIGINGERDPDCPLVPVPTPHGRLIDADALTDMDDVIHKTMVFGGQIVYAQKAIDNASTIIEAEGENE